ELDPARVLVRSKLLLHVLLDLAHERIVSLVRRTQDDERLRLDEPLVILPADDGRFQHRRMADDGRLDLRGRDPEAADVDHVVVAPAVDVVAGLVASVLFVATRPLAPEGGALLLPIVPV